MTMLGTVFIMSLVGSLHCAGMCGPLVAFAVGDTGEQSHRTRVLLHVFYHGGRFITYTLVGAVCGLLGAALNWGGSLVGLQRVAALLVGGMMIVAGTIAVLKYSGVRLPRIPETTFFRRWIVIGQRAAMGMRPLPRAATIGLLTAFLPCGWLYMFAIVATGTGSAAWGAAVMASFFVGTVPVLAALGISVQTLAGTVGRRVPLVTSLIIVALGVYTVGGWLTIPATAFENTRFESASDVSQQLEMVHQVEPPCCQNDAD